MSSTDAIYLPQLRHDALVTNCYRREGELQDAFPGIVIHMLAFTVLAGLAGAPVLAQTAVPTNAQGVPPGTNPVTGARPGNDVGTGMSMPMGTRASNIDAGRHALDDRAEPAEPVRWGRMPAPPITCAPRRRRSRRAAPVRRSSHSKWRRRVCSIVRCRLGQTNNPSDNPAVTQISQALQALAARDRAQAMQLIQSAIPAATASAQ